MQLTCGDAEQQGRRKRTRREIFLSEMEQVMPWKALMALINRTTQRQAAQAGNRIGLKPCCVSACCSSGMH